MACFPFGNRRSSPKKPRLFSHKDLHSATSGFSPSSLLGRGSHGSVFLAKLHNGRLLAAAKLSAPLSPFTANEISVLSSLPFSPHLVNLLGRSTDAAVVEFMPNGSLDDLIHRSSFPFAFPLRLRLAVGAAAAVAYLHALHPPVLHRDIKPSNILIDGDFRPRLADFGLAVRGLPSAAQPAGTMGYLDPGYLSPGDLSDKTDVYSFGVVLLELMTGRRAIDVEHSPASVVEWVVGVVGEGGFVGLWEGRGPREEEAAREVVRVAAMCVGVDAEGRPTMEEVVVWLRAAERRGGFRGMEKGWWKLGRRGKVADAAERGG